MAEILTTQYEINKPSSLTQIVYYNPESKTLAPIDALQLDLINAMYYMVNKSMHSNVMDADMKQRILNCDQDDLGFETFEIRMKDISTMMSKYQHGQYEKMIKKIKELRHVDVYINALNKDKDMTLTTTSIIGPINEIIGNNKSIKTAFPRVLIKSYFNTQKYFKKHYLAIQFSLKSKYSKLLYELAKDYEGLENGKTLDLKSIQMLLNVTTPNMLVPSRFKAHILKKTVDEINDSTDIFIEWEMVKVKKDYEVTIKSYKQDDTRLEQLGLINNITANKYYIRAKDKMDRMIATGYDVKNKEAWITEDLKRNSNNYEAMDNIDEFNENDQSVKNDFFANLAIMLNASDPIIGIDNYIIKEIFGTKTYSKDAEETYNLIIQCYDNFYEND